MSINTEKLSPEVQELLDMLERVYWCVDDASTVVDADEEAGEDYAYQATLKRAAALLEKYGVHTGRNIGGEPQ